MPPKPFYWRHARDSLITSSAIQMFQILSMHDGQIFDDVKQTIDSEYRTAVGTSAQARHGGIIQTQFQVFREAGWATLDEHGVVHVTPAGRQALLLFSKVPDFLKAAPYFLIELLSRFQLSNPARPDTRKNAEYDRQLSDSTVFPYWTLFKVMRACDDYVTTSELRRFVFQIRNQGDIERAIEGIKEFRKAVADGASKESLDTIFPQEIEGADGEPKYLMGRLGTQLGKNPPLVEKDGPSTWRLNRYYLHLVDGILENEPAFKDYLDEDTWIRQYGMPVDLIKDENGAYDVYDEATPLVSSLPDDDARFQEVQEIIRNGGVGVLFSGPPGTSKTWYARQIAIKLVGGDPTRAMFVQFHPSMAYDDFVEGYVPVAGQFSTSFEVRKKMLLKICDRARKTEPEICVLVIDEINRGDASRIFGELLTYVERSYRDVPFTMTYSGEKAAIPQNLFFIGTFNPFDRSVTELDDAMDRRFERIAFDPSSDLLRALLEQQEVNSDLIGKVLNYFAALNKLTRHGIGHTLFMTVRDDKSLRDLWSRKLRFILEKAFRFDPESQRVAKEGYLALFSDQSEPGI